MVEGAARQQRLTLIRIPDSCKMLSGPRGLRLIRIHSPFDYVLLKRGQAVIFDAKSIDQPTFSYSNITHHQMVTLSQCAKDCLHAGYLIHFRPTTEVVFMPVDKLTSLRKYHGLRPTDGIYLGNNGRMDLDALFRMSPLTPPPELPTE